jgi:hypothetical protein
MSKTPEQKLLEAKVNLLEKRKLAEKEYNIPIRKNSLPEQRIVEHFKEE